MGKQGKLVHCGLSRASRIVLIIECLAVLSFIIGLSGCGGGGNTGKKNNTFFTSGSKEADQRASQRMAKSEELSGSGEGAGEKGVKKATGGGSASSGQTTGGAQATQKLALFDRLGGTVGISNIVADVMPRLLQDPRVNWDRHGVKSGGLFHHGPSVTWDSTPSNVAILKEHMIEFLALATGGPAHYTGKEIKPVHAGMQISNPEFDAAVGDLKASLDRLKVPNTEQKELLAIIESTRPQIVEER